MEWSTYNSREDRFQSTLPLTYLRRTMEQHRQIPVSTYDIQPKHDVRIYRGGSEYLRTTFHLHLPTFLHSISAAETLNRWFLSNCEMFSIWAKISVHKWLNIKRCRSTSRDISDPLEIGPELTMDDPLDNNFEKITIRPTIAGSEPRTNCTLDNSSELMQRSLIS